MAGTWLKLAFIVILSLPVSTACPYLQCVNFSDPSKASDCNHIMNQGFSDGDEQQILCVLWNNGYGYENYQFPEYPDLETDLSFDYSEIDTSRFLLTFKIIMLLLFSYLVFSVLTKSSFIRKWLAA